MTGEGRFQLAALSVARGSMALGNPWLEFYRPEVTYGNSNLYNLLDNESP